MGGPLFIDILSIVLGSWIGFYAYDTIEKLTNIHPLLNLIASIGIAVLFFIVLGFILNKIWHHK